MATPRTLMLGDEPTTPILEKDPPTAPRKAAQVRAATETRTYDPDLAPVEGAGDTGLMAGAPVYASRTSNAGGGSGRKIAMVAIPLAVVAVAAGLVITSNSRKAPLTNTPVAAAPSTASSIAPMSEAPPPAQIATAAPAAPAPTATAAVSPPRSAATPVRRTASAARVPVRARSADTSASDASTVVPSAPVAPVASPPIDTPPPVLTVPAPTAPASVPPQTPPQ